MARSHLIFLPALLLAGSACTAAAPTESGAVIIRVVVTGYGGGPPMGGVGVDFRSYPSSSGLCNTGSTVSWVRGGTTDQSGTLTKEIDGLPLASSGTCLRIRAVPPAGSGLDGEMKLVLVYPQSGTPIDTTTVRLYVL